MKICKPNFDEKIIKIINKRKKDIVRIEHELPFYRLIAMNSDRSHIYQAENEEKLIITFRTNLYKTNSYEESKRKMTGRIIK